MRCRRSHTKRARDSAPSHGSEIRRPRTRGRDRDPGGSAQPNQSKSRALWKAACHAASNGPGSKVHRILTLPQLDAFTFLEKGPDNPGNHTPACASRTMDEA